MTGQYPIEDYQLTPYYIATFRKQLTLKQIRAMKKAALLLKKVQDRYLREVARAGRKKTLQRKPILKRLDTLGLPKPTDKQVDDMERAFRSDIKRKAQKLFKH